MTALSLFIADPFLADAVAEQLKLAGYDIMREGRDVADALKDNAVAAVIADDAAADKKFLKALRDAAAEKKKPVFLLGAAGEEGAGEVFAKPLRLGHLLARLQFHLEAVPRLRTAPLAFGPYRLEPQSRQIVMKGSDAVIRLTEKETALLEYLGQSEKSVSREELLASIWGYDARIDTHTLETHIYQLRRKLDADGGESWLINEQGAYRLKRGAAS